MPAMVVDSSLAASWCFPDERTDYTNAILQAISAPLEAVAPRLWAYEVRNAVLMGLRRKRITHADALEFLESIEGRPIRLADPVSDDGVFSLAGRHGQDEVLPRVGAPRRSPFVCLAAVTYSRHLHQ